MRQFIVLLVLAAGLLAACQVETPTDNTTQEVVELVNITIPVPEQSPSEEMVAETGVVVEATEGDLVQLKPEAVDPDEDEVMYYFTKPFNENGKWQTKEGDAGKYLVTVTASDGKSNTSQDVVIVIKRAKKAPVIECPPQISVKEGETINLNCNIYDPEEGADVLVEYSGFMKSPTYKTTFEDAGEYTTLIKAKNNFKEAAFTVKISVEDVNRAPELDNVPAVLEAMEGDIVTLSPEASDPDKDNVKLTFSAPFDDKGAWKTKIGDAGTYKSSVVANDGKTTTKIEFMVKVLMKNTAPVLKKIADITVYEGETVKIPIDATDREDDKLDVKVSGWMNSQSYTTSYEDAGEYSVTVTVSDGEFEDKQTFNVVVLDKNRPPVFKIPV